MTMSVSRSFQRLGQPSGQWVLAESQLASLEDGDAAKRHLKIVVVEDEDVRKFESGGLEIGERARVTGEKFVGRNVVATLRDAHGHALFTRFRAGDSNETEHHRVTSGDGFLQEDEFVAYRIGKDRFKHEALSLIDQFAAYGVGDFRCCVRLKVKFPGDDIGVDKTQASGLKVSVVKGGLARTVRPCERHDQRTPIERRVRHVARFFLSGLRAWNCRFTKRPTVRFPSASIRTKNPDSFGACS